AARLRCSLDAPWTPRPTRLATHEISGIRMEFPRAAELRSYPHTRFFGGDLAAAKVGAQDVLNVESGGMVGTTKRRDHHRAEAFFSDARLWCGVWDYDRQFRVVRMRDGRVATGWFDRPRDAQDLDTLIANCRS